MPDQESTCTICQKAIPAVAPGGLCPECLVRTGALGFDGAESSLALSEKQSPQSEALAPDTQLLIDEDDRYTYLGERGRGGMGRVLLVHDERLGRDVALKELLPREMEAQGNTPTPVRHSKEMVGRFLREARITGQLEHPSITPVHEIGRREDGTLYYTMKLVRGKTLAQALKDSRTLSARLELLPHFLDLCQAIGYAHSRGVIHRDIKPENVMVGDFGETVVIDWGLAKVTARTSANTELEEPTHKGGSPSSSEGEYIHTEYGQIMGTIRYMAPEQAEGAWEKVDERSDVYSLGVMLFQVLTGELPFKGTTRAELLRKLLVENPPDISAIESKVPPELAAICKRAMKKTPAERYATASELASDLERYQSGALVMAHEYSATRHIPRFIDKQKKPLAVAAFALLALVGLATYSYLNIVDANMEIQSAYEIAESNLYASRMLLAQQDLRDHAIIPLRAKLDSYIPKEGEPDLRGWEWYYLDAQCNQDLMSWQAHETGINDIDWDPEGVKLATAGTSGRIKIWSLDTDTEVLEIEGHNGAVLAIDWSPDGRLLASGGEDHSINIWDARDGSLQHKFSGRPGPVNAVAWHPDSTRLASGNDSSPLTSVWNVISGEVIDTHVSNSGGLLVAALSWSSDGQKLAASLKKDSWYETIVAWDTDTGSQLEEWTRLNPGSKTLDWSQDGRFLAVDRGASVLDTMNHTGEQLVPALQTGDLAMAWSPRENSIALADGKRLIQVWDWDTKSQTGNFFGHAANVHALKWHPEGHLLATADEQGVVKLWASDMKYSPTDIIDLQGKTETVSWSPDSRKILRAEQGRVARFQDIVNNNSEIVLPCRNVVWCAKYSPRGNYIATSGASGTIDIWNGDGSKKFHELHFGIGWNVNELHWSSDDRYLATQVLSRLEAIPIRIWDVEFGKVVQVLPEALANIAWHPLDNSIAACGRDGKIHFLHGTSGAVVAPPLEILPADRGFAQYTQWSPDGRLLSVKLPNGDIQIWDIQRREQVALLGAGDFKESCWSPDSKRIASRGRNSSVNIFDVMTGNLVQKLEGRDAETMFFGVEWSPDGGFLAVGDSYGTRIYDARLLTPEIRAERMARYEVDRYFGQMMTQEEALHKIKSSPILSPKIKQTATKIATKSVENPVRLNQQGWDIVVQKNHAMADYARAMHALERAYSLMPLEGAILNTLGVAQYRCGRYEEALDTLIQAGILKGGLSEDLLFQAFCLKKLGRSQSSFETLTQMHASPNFQLFLETEDGRLLLTEAEEIFGADLLDHAAELGLQRAATMDPNRDYVLETILNGTKLVDGWKPSWSPDKSKIAYTSQQKQGIRILEIASGENREIREFGKDPAWSPDGRHIAFVDDRVGSDPDVWIVEPSGQGARRIMPGEWVTWSPDSKKLYAYAPHENALKSILLDDKDAEPVLFYDAPPSRFCEVSPDEKYVAFGDGGTFLVVDRVSREEFVRWPFYMDTTIFASWSPDGKSILFWGYWDEPIGAWLYNFYERTARKITDGVYSSLAWSHGGEKIAFEKHHDGNREIWSIDAVALEQLYPLQIPPPQSQLLSNTP